MDLIQWCHRHNAKVIFKYPNSVEVKVSGCQKVYAYSLEDAIKAIEEILALKHLKFEYGCCTQEQVV